MRERARTIAGPCSAGIRRAVHRSAMCASSMATSVVDRTSVIVRDGKIAEVGVDLASPLRRKVIEGAGRTLIPGLIDAHTHAFGDALARALVFGVTTELDMFTDHKMAAEWRTEQNAAGGASARADIFSAGMLVTAPGGHGTQFGTPIPTLTSPQDAVAFVDARLAEGSDFIKVVYNPGDGFGISLPSLDEPTLRAVIAAAKARGKLGVVHIGSRAAAETAIAAGASGLVTSSATSRRRRRSGPRRRRPVHS